MKAFHKPIFGCPKGMTLIEILVALTLTGILATAALSFFSGMHNQSVTQRNVAEMKDLARASLMEIKKTLRMAGYKLAPGHAPFEVFGSTLGVYYSNTQSVDTIWLYLQEFTDSEYSTLVKLPKGRRLFRLMRLTNSGLPEPYSDFIVNLRYSVIDSVNVEISVTTQTPKHDMDWPLNGGYRTYSTSERVKIRNAG
jgi:prepilin-type N-terminal cleavage/methylation domain-containing protein